MFNKPFRDKIIRIAIITSILALPCFLFTQDSALGESDNRGYILDQQATEIKKAPAPASDKTVEFTEFQKLARDYRSKGLELQQLGDFNGALVLYQKAVELDPSFAPVYNDLGVIYEARGEIERAQDSYKSAIQRDPLFLGAYTNLAFLYENKRDLNKAVQYWKKRVALGEPEDPWTQKAKKRLQDLREVIPELKKEGIELETMELIGEMDEQKRLKQLEDMAKAKTHFTQAKKFYGASDYKQALVEIESVLSLNPQGKDAVLLKDKIQTGLKQQIKAQNIKKMQSHFQDGIRYYEHDNLHAASREFRELEELAESPQE